MASLQTVPRGLRGGVLGRLWRGLGHFWGVFWVLTRLRADTAERGTSRERHRWANVCGKCRVLQCPFNDVQGVLFNRFAHSAGPCRRADERRRYE